LAEATTDPGAVHPTTDRHPIDLFSPPTVTTNTHPHLQHMPKATTNPTPSKPHLAIRLAATTDARQRLDSEEQRLVEALAELKADTALDEPQYLAKVLAAETALAGIPKQRELLDSRLDSIDRELKAWVKENAMAPLAKVQSLKKEALECVSDRIAPLFDVYGEGGDAPAEIANQIAFHNTYFRRLHAIEAEIAAATEYGATPGLACDRLVEAVRSLETLPTNPLI
jgi:hypothetical protein